MDNHQNTLSYIHYNIIYVSRHFPNVDKNILKSALAYQYLSSIFFPKALSIKEILIENNWEIGLIGPCKSILTSILEFIYGKSSICRMHSCLHDAYGRFYSRYRLGRGYTYAVKNGLRSFCLMGHISGLLWCIVNKRHWGSG